MSARVIPRRMLYSDILHFRIDPAGCSTLPGRAWKGNGIDAHDKHREEQEQSRECQHGKTAMAFKRIGMAVGNESDEHVWGKYEVRRHAGTLGQEVVDEQGDGKQRQQKS